LNFKFPLVSPLIPLGTGATYMTTTSQAVTLNPTSLSSGACPFNNFSNVTCPN
jgi:hypothetical protein